LKEPAAGQESAADKKRDETQNGSALPVDGHAIGESQAVGLDEKEDCQISVRGSRALARTGAHVERASAASVALLAPN
jgi:hypothetical protein